MQIRTKMRYTNLLLISRTDHLVKLLSYSLEDKNPKIRYEKLRCKLEKLERFT